MKIIAKQLDDEHNRDMIVLTSLQGEAYAITHVDLFWELGSKGLNTFRCRLERGETIILEVTEAIDKESSSVQEKAETQAD